MQPLPVFLGQLTVQLNSVLQLMTQAQAVAPQVEATYRGLSTALEASGAAIKTASDGAKLAADAAVLQSDRVATAADQANSRVAQASEVAVSQLQEAKARAVAQATELQALAATAFDDLRHRAESWESAWADSIRAGLDAVAVGAVTLQEFLTEFGDNRLKIGDELTSISALLSGVNFVPFEQQLERLLLNMQTGQADISQALAFLEESNSQFARKLLEVISLFRQGKVTLDAVLEVTNAIESQFAGSNFADFAQTLAQTLQNGDRDGAI